MQVNNFFIAKDSQGNQAWNLVELNKKVRFIYITPKFIYI